jgi:hypothetical protein
VRVRFPLNNYVSANFGYAHFWAGEFTKTETEKTGLIEDKLPEVVTLINPGVLSTPVVFKATLAISEDILVIIASIAEVLTPIAFNSSHVH